MIIKRCFNEAKNYGYSASIGIYKLRLAICNWYKIQCGFLDPDKHACATMGSKEGYVHLVQAIVNVGDVVVVPDPTYPIQDLCIYVKWCSLFINLSWF